MTTQLSQHEIDVHEMMANTEVGKTNIATLVDTAIEIKNSLDSLSEDLEGIKEGLRKLAQLEVTPEEIAMATRPGEPPIIGKSVFVGTKGIIEVLDDAKSSISPVILKGYLEANGKGEMFMKMISVLVSKVRDYMGDNTVLDIGKTEHKFRTKVYIKGRK